MEQRSLPSVQSLKAAQGRPRCDLLIGKAMRGIETSVRLQCFLRGLSRTWPLPHPSLRDLQYHYPCGGIRKHLIEWNPSTNQHPLRNNQTQTSAKAPTICRGNETGADTVLSLPLPSLHLECLRSHCICRYALLPWSGVVAAQLYRLQALRGPAKDCISIQLRKVTKRDGKRFVSTGEFESFFRHECYQRTLKAVPTPNGLLARVDCFQHRSNPIHRQTVSGCVHT